MPTALRGRSPICFETTKSRPNTRRPPPHYNRLAPWNSIADLIKALLDRSKARLNLVFEFQIGKNVRPVVFDDFADEFADVSRIDALRHTFADLIVDRF